jgi:arylsulfatase
MPSDPVQREILPIPDRPYAGPVKYDAKDPEAKFPPIKPLRPPAGAPNVLVILIDDAGFGSSSTFGGPCETPTFDRLAKGGLRYTRFHTTALCSPTRAALLTGRNHHSVGMGGITEIATSAPGYNSMRPNTAANVAEVLTLNGYSTAHFGKCHEVPVWETSPMGPFDRWPTGNGFEKFYGFIGGETNQWEPALYDNQTPIDPPKDPNYHLTEDLAKQCRHWIREQKAVTKHRTPWEIKGAQIPFDQDNWELYDTSKDWSQSRNIAREQSEKLAELQRLWLIEAVKYNVLPLDDRTGERFNSDLAGRPQLVGTRGRGS